MLRTTAKSTVGILLWLQLAADVATGVDQPCRFTAFTSHWLQEDGSLRFPTYSQGENSNGVWDAAIGLRRVSKVVETLPWHSTDNATEEPACRFSEDSEDAVCKDTIDYDFLRRIRDRRVKTFTVDSYNSRETTKRRDSNRRTESYVQSPVEKITGELRLRDIHVEMSATLDMRKADHNKFVVGGEVFSNRIIKVGWKYKGEVTVREMDSFTWADVEIDASEYENGWTLVGRVHLTPGGGSFYGNVTHNDGVPPVIHFHGTFNTNLTGAERTFDGALEAKGVDMAGDFFGRMTKCVSVVITIPKRAFSNMHIENLVFKDSFFFGDFHNQSFEGIKRLRTVTFSKSVMEFMPDYSAIFRGSSLKAIYIEDSNTPSITTGANCNVQGLELLSFKGSGFLEFSAKTFQWLSCSNLTFLNFHNTNFKLISNESIWEPIGDTLKYLDISYSTLRHEPSLRQFLKGSKITHLSLAGLHLKRVPTSALETVKNTLRYLSLRKNNFEKIPGENMLVTILTFPAMQNLQELDLHGCHINYIEKRAFDSLTNLKWLDLSQNNIANLQDGWAEMKPKITFLNLSHNGLVTRASGINMFDVKDLLDLSVFDRLETLDLAYNRLRYNNGLSANLINLHYLSLCKCGLQSLNDSLLQAVPNLEEIDLSGNPELGKRISFEELKHLKSLKVLHLTHNGILNFTVYDNETSAAEYSISSLEYLDLSCNNIKFLRPNVLSLMPNLKTLVLSRNNILHWPKDLLKSAPSLERILLDSNKIDSLKLTEIADMTYLNEFTLGNNPFVCGCFVLDFLKRLHKTDIGYYLCPESVKLSELLEFERRTVKLTNWGIMREISVSTFGSSRKVYRYGGGCAKMRDWSQFDYQCYSRSLRRNVPFEIVDESFEECHTEISQEYFDWISVMVTVTLLFSLFVGFVWWKWWNFRLFAKMLKSAAVVSFMDKDECERAAFEYDAFVSYTDNDRLWVTEKLIPNLEKLNDIKICLHERDFQVGLSILENIVTSIDKSKCIILILSQAFVKSQWCQYEMHLAYHRLLETRRDQMILILLENIPRHKRPKTLQYLMMTKTYIQWPSSAKNAKELEIFWNRLFKALLYINQF